ncbi:alkene reductase [Methylobacterium oryzisoli]|uniref:alkene reductase n=1 Tax=Methylobacterium oryzisoli TaxID=3385502 RepID=UPI0038920EE8
MDPQESTVTDIWTPITLGRAALRNRLVMAPMTRSRAEPDGTPGPLAAAYYAQRAGLGLLVSEGTQPSAEGQGYIFTPGLYTDRHVDGWRQVTSAVHEAGSRLFIQLMHVGRMAHPDNTPGHAPGVAPSAVAPADQMFTLAGLQPIPAPRALSLDGIARTVDDFRHAARRAVEAGADGVEIHGANGYLVQQFFAPNANLRTDRYGGGIVNRARFAIEVARAVAAEIGGERTGIRLSPGATLGSLDEGPEAPDLYRHLVGELDRAGLAYIHVMHLGNEALLADIRRLWSRALIVNRPGRALQDVGSDITAGRADLESYGQLVLSTPDFVARLKSGAAMNPADKATFYGGGAKGYTDYPILSGEAA